MKNNYRKKPINEINVVPYIDVMLVLLVIFMITAPLLTQGVNVELPKAHARILSRDDNVPIIVTVDSHGKYFLNTNSTPNQEISARDLTLHVAALLKLNQQSGTLQAVLVKGDSKVNYGAVVQAMVLLQQAGAKNIGLMTSNPDDSPSLINSLNPNQARS